MTLKTIFGIFFFFSSLTLGAQVSDTEMRNVRDEFNKGYEDGDALPLIQKILEKDPNNWEALYMYYMVKTEYEPADSLSISALFKSVQMNREFDDSQHALALYYWEIDSLNLALLHFNQCIHLNSNHFGVYYNRANLNFELQNYQECIDDVNMAKVNQKFIEPELIAIEARAYIALGNFPSAKKILDALLKVENTPENHKILGEYHFKLDNFTEAVKEYEIANQPEWDGGFGFLNMAKCYLALEKIDAACFYYQKGREIHVPVQSEFESLCLD